jgi:hypothetical protein
MLVAGATDTSFLSGKSTVDHALLSAEKSRHNDGDNDNDAALSNKMLFELVAQSCKVPARIRTIKSEADFNAIANRLILYKSCKCETDGRASNTRRSRIQETYTSSSNRRY